MGPALDAVIAWAIERRAVVVLGAVLLLLGGGWLGSHAATDVLPDFTPVRVVVQTEAPGMSAPDVEVLVTRPLERSLLGTPQASSVRSISSPGLSVVTLFFEEGVELFRARQLVTERISLARAQLPTSASEPRLAPISAPVGALFKICLTSTATDTPQAQRDLRAFADWTLRPRLLAIPGVAQVTALGGSVERFEVRPDPLRLAAREVTAAEVLTAVRASQAVLGAGFLETGESRMDLQLATRLDPTRLRQMLGGLPVAVRAGTIVRLEEVAEFTTGEEPPVGGALYDGRPAVYLQINKVPWADTLAVTASVERALAELERDLPPGGRLEAPVFRQASLVQTSIHSVGRAMALGGVLVILILWIFLRSGRLAFVSLIAIPLSIAAAVGVLVLRGESINGMTLGGLALAVGEVVDDAIVDVENVWRRLRENAALARPLPALEVVRSASREIRGSVVYATLLVCLVLVPVLTLGGIAGRIFAPLATAYILAIAASLAVALTVTPALCALLLPGAVQRESRPTLVARLLSHGYRRVLRSVAGHPLALGVASLALVVSAAAVLPRLGGRFLPEFREGALIAHVYLAPGTSLGESMRVTARLHAQLAPVVTHVAARAGRAELDEDAAPVHRVELDLVLREDGRTWEARRDEVRTRMQRVPGVTFVLEEFLGERVHEILAGDTAPIVVRVLGPELGPLRASAAQVARTLAETPGLASVRGEPQIDVPQLRVVPEPTALLRYGVQPQEIAETVALWQRGQAATQVLARGGRLLDLTVVGAPTLRSWSALPDLPLATRLGPVVPLGTLARVERVGAPVVLQHEQGERRVNLTADAQGASLSVATARAEARLHALHLPPGYRVELSGEALARRDAGSRLVFTGLLVLLGLFALLLVAFRSARDATMVLANLPLGLVGGVFAAWAGPDGLSVAGFVGFVTLFGIIARNGIMLVSHLRHLESEHPELDPVERVFQGAEERLLPILMTAATAGLGLLPLAASFEAAGSELEAPMARIVCGGLLTSTVLNMLVLPTLYVWLARREARRSSPDGGPR